MTGGDVLVAVARAACEPLAPSVIAYRMGMGEAEVRRCLRQVGWPDLDATRWWLRGRQAAGE